MDQIFSAADIGSAIQSALAPVFLLTAIAGLLNVLVHRLSRVVDRARHLEANAAGFAADKRRIAIDVDRLAVGAAVADGQESPFAIDLA